MEPCLFRHGKGAETFVKCSTVAIGLQWSHVFSAEDRYTHAPTIERANEPCLFRHGKRKTCRTARIKGFNGAMSFRHIRVLFLDSKPITLLLQWSHVFSDMVRKHGEICITFPLLLQWSHVFSDMVRRSSAPCRSRTSSLQWSHVFSDMVRSPKPVVEKFRIIRLQWSHVFSDMVRRPRLSRVPGVRSGFNGAMSFQTW